MMQPQLYAKKPSREEGDGMFPCKGFTHYNLLHNSGKFIFFQQYVKAESSTQLISILPVSLGME